METIGVYAYTTGNYVDYDNSLAILYEQEGYEINHDEVVNSISKNWEELCSRAEKDRDRVRDAHERGIVDPGFGFGIKSIFIASNKNEKWDKHMIYEPSVKDVLISNLCECAECSEVIAYLEYDQLLKNPEQIEDISPEEMLLVMTKISTEQERKNVDKGSGLQSLLSAANASDNKSDN